MKNKISINMFFSLVLQLVTIASGLIIPRLILGAFGSEINGLVSSINQLLNYITLLEGGVSSVMMASLYKPLIAHDEIQLSSLIKTISGFFRNLSMVFAAYTFILGIVYPLIVGTSFSWMYVFTLTLILSLNRIIQYTFAITSRLLLDADNKVYITSIVQIICTILNTVLVYIGLFIYPNIHVVKIITAVVFILQPLGYQLYVNKNYKLIKNCEKDKNAITQRWAGFGINIAAFVHTNTDIVVITAFKDLFAVSVYSVYHLVFNGIKTVISAIFNGMIPSLGKLLAKGDINILKSYYETYEFFAFSLSAIFISIGAILIVPFVEIYTRTITDANYYQPLFAFIMMAAEFFYCIRNPYLNLAYQSGHFKEISKYAYTEAIINIIISVTLVNFLGIVGVALGTLVSNIYRTVAQVIYSKSILDRSVFIFVKYTLVYSGMSALSYLFTKFLIRMEITGFGSLIIYAIFASLVTAVVYFSVTSIFYRPNLKKMYDIIHYK